MPGPGDLVLERDRREGSTSWFAAVEGTYVEFVCPGAKCGAVSAKALIVQSLDISTSFFLCKFSLRHAGTFCCCFVRLMIMKFINNCKLLEVIKTYLCAFD